MAIKTPLQTLLDYHGQKLTAEQSGDYDWFFQRRSDIAEKIANRWKFKHSPRDRLPSLSDLTAIAIEIQEEQWQKIKASSPTFEDLEKTIGGAKPSGIEAIATMRKLYAGQISHPDYLAWMFDMEKRYPGLGWQREAKDLEKFWSTKTKREAKSQELLKKMDDIRRSNSKAKD